VLLVFPGNRNLISFWSVPNANFILTLYFYLNLTSG
jgi:hypothetical protein